jgi:pimeloyl-ACP methyl ester carboxylesterase
MEHLAVLRDGLEVPYVEQGDRDGVPVVLLHAWLDSRRCFDQLMAALPEWIRAFAFDQRGHGDAARPANGYGIEDFAGDIGAFMEAVGLEATVLAGASSGGYVAQRFAVDNPARTLGLALLGSPARCAGGGRRSPACSQRSRTRSMRALSMSSTTGCSGARFPPRSWQLSARRTSRCRRASGVMRSRVAEPPLDSGRIPVPTLIVWGARDSLLPRADQEAMAQEIPGARLVIYADVGHLPVIEAPSVSLPISPHYASRSRHAMQNSECRLHSHLRREASVLTTASTPSLETNPRAHTCPVAAAICTRMRLGDPRAYTRSRNAHCETEQRRCRR